MTAAKAAEFELLLTSRGWHYDVEAGEFVKGECRGGCEVVLELVPGMTADELEAWEANQRDRWLEIGLAEVQSEVCR
jgi:hypothetical protein